MLFELFVYSFVISTFLLVFLIPFLKFLKYGQNIRKEGPQKHLKKQGTPTMGGVCFVITILSIFVYYGYKYEIKNFLLYILLPLTYFVIGLLDDLLIIKKKKGLGVYSKLFLQIFVAAIYAYLIYLYKFDTKIYLFNKVFDLKWGYGLFVLLIFLATTNAVNLSDGIDGLASGLSIICLISISIISFVRKNSDVLVFSLITISSLMAFLCFNKNPAKVFMGNTGSLFLGAVIANLMILLKLELYLIILGFVFVLEALSVMIQVTYFKITKGKRIFLMTPIHHHFELKGYNEWQVDFLFWFMASLFAIITLLMVL